MAFNSGSATQPKSAAAAMPPLAALAMGDAYWERRKNAPRETDVALQWPEDVLLSFNVRMAGHGVKISRVQMMCDRRYATQQLMFAHSLPDVRLQKLAAQLLIHLEERQGNKRPSMH